MTKKKQEPDGFSALVDFSHEIRNPLNGISGMVNILLDSQLSPEQISYVRHIQEKSNELNKVLSLMLDYSKLLNGMINHLPEQIFIYPYLQKELDKIFRSFRKRRIKFCYYIPPALSGIAIFDPYVFSQIIRLSCDLISPKQSQSKFDLEIIADEDLIKFEYKTPQEKIHEKNPEDNHRSQITRLLLSKYLHLAGGEIIQQEPDNPDELNIRIPVKYNPADVNTHYIKKKEQLKNRSLIFFNYFGDSCESTVRYLKHLGMNLSNEERDLNQLSKGELDTKYNIIGIDISQLAKHEFQIMDDIRQFSQLPIIMFKDADKTEQKVLTLQKDVVVLYKPVSPNNLSFVIESVLNSEADQLRDWIKNPISVLADYHNQLNILIADDENINQRVLREYLGKLHLKADFVSNGLKAVEMYKSKKYDLIFMDIQMPLMDGVESVKKIRNIRNGHHPYIIAITADALKGGRQKYLEAGMNDYLLKPVNLEGITKIIQKFIERFKH